MENINPESDEYLWSLQNYSYETFYNSPVLRRLNSYLTRCPLVDLGGRHGLSKRKLLALGVEDYTVVDIQPEGVHFNNHIQSDALSFLLGVEDNDMNVMANGFLKSEIVSVGYASAILQQVMRIIRPHNRAFVTAGFSFDEMAKDIGLKLALHASANVKVWK